ncbi:DUF4328 domain-containing protein [Streptomyces otsuchiensis]|uniref:DUF4328 domain-containing protein n=1 Tax=Streptomyces otsuchiensis TaxID=2681388 RepID=UPI001476FEFB|nr:DUF4328 domain-containing protein [Streptomyces otsuchiensis]
MRRFKPLRLLAATASLLLAACALLSWRRLEAGREKLAYLARSHDIDPAGMTVRQWRAAERALLPEDVRIAGLIENATGPWVVVGTLTAGFFLLWFRRARGNARLLSGREPSVRDGFAYVGWLVPPANIVVPRRTVGELRPPGTAGGKIVLHVWWLLWGAVVLVSAFAFWLWWEQAPQAGGRLAAGKVPASEPLENAVRALAVADGLLMACAGAAIVLLWRMTRLQERALRAGPPPGPREPAVGELTRDQLLNRVVANWDDSGRSGKGGHPAVPGGTGDSRPRPGAASGRRPSGGATRFGARDVPGRRGPAAARDRPVRPGHLGHPGRSGGPGRGDGGEG